MSTEANNGYNGHGPIDCSGNMLFRAMMASTAAALELHPQTLRPIGERAARLALIQIAAEQTYAENIAFTQARECREASAAALAEQAVAGTEVVMASM